jgi:hypothetical protein
MSKNNVIDFSLYQFKNRAKEAADMWNSLLVEDLTDEEFEALFEISLELDPYGEPSNDNFSFADMLECFLPETKNEYEKLFGANVDFFSTQNSFETTKEPS